MPTRVPARTAQDGERESIRLLVPRRGDPWSGCRHSPRRRREAHTVERAYGHRRARRRSDTGEEGRCLPCTA